MPGGQGDRRRPRRRIVVVELLGQRAHGPSCPSGLVVEELKRVDGDAHVLFAFPELAFNGSLVYRGLLLRYGAFIFPLLRVRVPLLVYVVGGDIEPGDGGGRVVVDRGLRGLRIDRPRLVLGDAAGVDHVAGREIVGRGPRESQPAAAIDEPRPAPRGGDDVQPLGEGPVRVGGAVDAESRPSVVGFEGGVPRYAVGAGDFADPVRRPHPALRERPH